MRPCSGPNRTGHQTVPYPQSEAGCPDPPSRSSVCPEANAEERMKKSIEITPNIEALFGTRDENLHVLEDGLNITIDMRANSIELEGAARDVARAEQVFSDYDHLQRSGHVFNNGDLNSMLRVLMADPKASLRGLAEAGRQRSFGRRT